MIEVAIIGGGLAGLINGILLSRAGLSVVLFEKNTYPFHRVCGEYISNEAIPFLENNGLFPHALNPSTIDELQISSIKGRDFVRPLDLGGFGVSRYAYDQWLVSQARSSGVRIYEGTLVSEVQFSDEYFTLKSSDATTHQFKMVIGAYGKRAKLDQTLNRDFLIKKSPYVGVKYHINSDLPRNRISLHNFEGGYCGVSRIEDNKFNLCYLTHRDQIRKSGSIDGFEREVMIKNPRLKEVMENAEFLLDKPEVINEITFEKQEPIVNHIFMCGDAAGMITPLCGNGMAMAIHSAKILSSLIIEAKEFSVFPRKKLEGTYARAWKNQFGMRLWAGRKIQGLFGDGAMSEVAVGLGKYVKPVTKFLVSQTHGQPFS